VSERQRKERAKRERVAHIAGYTSERQTAEALGKKVRTLRLWRWRGEGPPYVKLGAQVYYRDEAVAAWLLRHEVQPVRELVTA
jgi:hypothetical protein